MNKETSKDNNNNNSSIYSNFKLKPFKMQSDKFSAQEIQNVFDFCVKYRGIAAKYRIYEASTDIDYNNGKFKEDWNYFGVSNICGNLVTDYTDFADGYFTTMARVNAHIGRDEKTGLPVEFVNHNINVDSGNLTINKSSKKSAQKIPIQNGKLLFVYSSSEYHVNGVVSLSIQENVVSYISNRQSKTNGVVKSINEIVEVSTKGLKYIIYRHPLKNSVQVIFDVDNTGHVIQVIETKKTNSKETLSF